MAQGYTFVCGECGHSLLSWGDGNPYFYDESGKKQYAYHPDDEALARCIGNDSEHICLSCGHEFLIDSLKPVRKCPECESGKIRDTFSLHDERCPFCKKGTFFGEPGPIS